MAQTHKNEEQLATAPIGRLMLKLAVPTVAAQLINMLYNIVDRIYIGHIPGREARRWPPSSWGREKRTRRSGSWATP